MRTIILWEQQMIHHNKPSAGSSRRLARRGAIPAVSLYALVFLAGCGSQASGPQEPPPPAVSVSVVEAQEVQQWQTYNGRVEAAETVTLRPRVSGHIDNVNYTEGSPVEAGDVLFVIDQRTYRAALEQARAELKRAETQVELARTEMARADRLAEARAISAEELDQRSAAVAQAEANLQAARASMAVAELDMEFTRVRAPVSGIAGRAHVTTGNLVSTEPNATVLTTIVSVDPVHVYFESDETSYLSFQSGTNGHSNGRNGGNPVQVGLSGDPGFPHTGFMDFMDNHVDPETGTIRARAVLPNPDHRLTPGLFARVRLLEHGTTEAILIDEKAILTDQDRKYVYVVNEENQAIRRDIRTGRRMDGLRMITDGLAPGDHLIVRGVQKVFFPGMPVAPEILNGHGDSDALDSILPEGEFLP